MELLKNELKPLGDLLLRKAGQDDHWQALECFSCELQKISSSIRESWEAAVFADVDDGRLNRYFSYEMDSLRQMLLSEDPENVTLILPEVSRLMTHLYTHFGTYLSNDTLVNYNLLELAQLKEDVQKFISHLENPRLHQELARCLLSSVFWLSERPQADIISTGSLRYMQNLVYTLLPVVSSGKEHEINQNLAETLFMLNFNHHGFFKFLADGIRKDIKGFDTAGRLAYFQNEFGNFPVLPENTDCLHYNTNWPPLSNMLRNWLLEEIAVLRKLVIEEENTLPVVSRLPYLLSVAQHACLTRFFYDAGIYNTTVAEVIAFSASHSSSKRQMIISEGSYEKEYYSITQKTAAMVLDLLQKTAASLKKSFFP